MNNISIQLSPALEQIIEETYNVSVTDFEFQATRKEFEGDITLVVFALLKVVKGNPTQIGKDIGNALLERLKWVKGFNVVKGFLNIEISDAFFIQELQNIRNKPNYGKLSLDDSSGTVLVEYSSPNTNKPLHLGHIRNNLLGFAVANILEASGKRVVKTQIINDRGIHICKSMVAWQHFGNGETPQSTGLKGDKLVGNYYVLFDKKYKEEVAVLISEGLSEEDAKTNAPLFIKAKKMLKLWESGDSETVNLWKTMNSWVYDGFAKTYNLMGVSFDSYYYESETYLLGKIIEEGLSDQFFIKKKMVRFG